MPIDLPPVDVHAASHLEVELPSTGEELRMRTVRGSFNVRGVQLISHEELAAIVAGATSIAAVADAIADAYQKRGWRNVLVLAVDTPERPTIYVSEHGLRAAHGAPQLTRYFTQFVGQPAIEYSDFAIAARLAETHATRVGSDVAASYRRAEESPYDTAMTLHTQERRPSAFDHQFNLANTGNRYLGRWFGSAAVSWTALSSWRVGAAIDHAFPELDDTRGRADYNAISAFVDRVTQLGLFRVVAAYADYEYTADGVNERPVGEQEGDPQLAATNLSLGVQGEHFLHLTPTWSWIVGEGITHSDYDIELIGSTLSAEETYTAAHLALSGKWRDDLRSGRPAAFIDLQFRQSLSDSFRSLDADDGFNAMTYGAGVAITPNPLLRVSLSFTGQYSSFALPQAEEWVLGGLDRLSAWLPGVTAGDRGMLMQVKAEVPVWGRDHRSLIISAIAERGTSEFSDGANALHSTLSSAGLGAMFQFARYWSMDARLSTPLKEDAPDDFEIEEQEVDFYMRVRRAWDAP